MSSLRISIDRTSLDLGPLEMLGHGDEPGLAVSDYTEPAMQARVTYAPESSYLHGATPIAVAWQQGVLSFSVFADGAATEAQSRGWMAELTTAVMRLSYPVTVQVDDAPAETWVCTGGTITPAGGRTTANLVDHNPQWSVSLPCFPIRTT